VPVTFLDRLPFMQIIDFFKLDALTAVKSLELIDENAI
jgi:hypothetical protein